MEVTVSDIKRTYRFDFRDLTSTLLVFVLVMPEVRRLRSRFVLTINGHSRPAELEQHEH